MALCVKWHVQNLQCGLEEINGKFLLEKLAYRVSVTTFYKTESSNIENRK